MIPYFQSTPFTTAASSLLTILHKYKPEIALTKENEFDIWKKTVNLPTRASSIFALATYAKKKGLQPRVVVENESYNFPDYRFFRYTKEDVEHAAFTADMHLAQAKRFQVNIQVENITLDKIKKELKEGKTLLLRVNAKHLRNGKKNTSNYIVVHAYDGNYFSIVDPCFGALSIPEHIMEKSFHTLETKKYRDHRMIVF